MAAVLALLLAGTGMAASPPGPAGNAPAVLAVHLDPIWTSPLTEDPVKSTPWPTAGFVPDAWAEAPDGTLVLLGTLHGPGRGDRVVLRNADRAGPETAIPLVLPTAEPPGLQRLPGLLFGHVAPNLYRDIDSVAIGRDGSMWLAGGINVALDIASGRHADAYLVKLDAAGRVVWEQAYSDGRALGISSIALTGTGGAIVAGSAFSTYVDASWLARVGPNGARLQEWRLGSGKDLEVLPMQDGRTLVVGIAEGGVVAGGGSHRDAALAAAKAGTYRDDVVAWMLGEAGPPQGPVPVREGISRNDAFRGPGGGAASIAMARTGDAAYVATNWLDAVRPAGVEVARIGPYGVVAWRQALPETIAPLGEGRAFSCAPSVAALSNGDALVACALNGRVQLHRLDGRTGERHFASMAPPPCQKGGHASGVSVIARQDGTVLVRGVGYADDGDVGCSWMARLTVGAG